MISGEMIQMLTMSGVTGAVIASGTIFAFLKKKKVNVPKVINMVKQTADAATPLIDLAKTIAPNNPVVNIADFIKEWAKTGAKNAEQLYYSNQLNGQDRISVAKQTVYNALKEFGITPTENQEKLISDTIEAAVNDFGHNKTEAEKEAKKQALQAQVVQLTAENAQLKNAITTAASTVQATNQTA